MAAAQEEIDALCEKVKSAKGKAVKLAVSGAFHSPFMNEAADGLADYLKDITLSEPQIPVYANCTAEPYADDYKMLKTIAKSAFKKDYNLYSGRAAVTRAKTEGGAIAVFGHGWGGELSRSARSSGEVAH